MAYGLWIRVGLNGRWQIQGQASWLMAYGLWLRVRLHGVLLIFLAREFRASICYGARAQDLFHLLWGKGLRVWGSVPLPFGLIGRLENER